MIGMMEWIIWHYVPEWRWLALCITVYVMIVELNCIFLFYSPSSSGLYFEADVRHQGQRPVVMAPLWKERFLRRTQRG